MFKFAYIGVIGKTNAGKSTLVNALVGEKVAIVSPKTQTTRDNILGILTKENYQLVFVDTPGIHKSKNYLDKKMMKDVRSAISSVDILLYVIDVSKPISDDEVSYIQHLGDERPLIVVYNKIDKCNKDFAIKNMLKLMNLLNITAFATVSAKLKRNIDAVLDELLKQIPESETKNFAYDEDLYTDKSLRFLTSEAIREKTLYLLNEELPHGIHVQIEKFDERKKIVYIDACLICEKETHKAIILGKNGSMIKKIGIQAREDIEKLIQKKVMLKIYVKVIKDWRQKQNLDFL